MSHWNYRVFKHTDSKHKMGDSSNVIEDITYAIHEVYYEEDNTMFGHTAKPIQITGESVEDLRTEIKRIEEALDKPILTSRDCYE